jgi:hypothetical protein
MSAVRFKARWPRSLSLKRPTIPRAHPFAAATITTIGALAVAAFVNHRWAKDAENDNPPAGRFLEVNGVRLHYVERAQARRWSCCTETAA